MSGSKILPYLQANKLVFYCFRDAGVRHDTPASKTKDFVTQDTVSSIKTSKFALVPFFSKYQRGLIAPGVDCVTGGDP